MNGVGEVGGLIKVVNGEVGVGGFEVDHFGQKQLHFFFKIHHILSKPTTNHSPPPKSFTIPSPPLFPHPFFPTLPHNVAFDPLPHPYHH